MKQELAHQAGLPTKEKRQEECNIADSGWSGLPSAEDLGEAYPTMPPFLKRD